MEVRGSGGPLPSGCRCRCFRPDCKGDGRRVRQGPNASAVPYMMNSITFDALLPRGIPNLIAAVEAGFLARCASVRGERGRLLLSHRRSKDFGAKLRVHVFPSSLLALPLAFRRGSGRRRRIGRRGRRARRHQARQRGYNLRQPRIPAALALGLRRRGRHRGRLSSRIEHFGRRAPRGSCWRSAASGTGARGRFAFAGWGLPARTGAHRCFGCRTSRLGRGRRPRPPPRAADHVFVLFVEHEDELLLCLGFPVVRQALEHRLHAPALLTTGHQHASRARSWRGGPRERGAQLIGRDGVEAELLLDHRVVAVAGVPVIPAKQLLMAQLHPVSDGHKCHGAALPPKNPPEVPARGWIPGRIRGLRTRQKRRQRGGV
eukprot:scaffold8030_cov229-Pinguiococcus_pyrenoidosus.AAC.3